MGCDVMSRLRDNKIGSSAIKAAGPSEFTRFAGGSKRINQPFISGYWYVAFRLPEHIFKSNKQDSERWLFTTAESFTPHSRSLTKADVPGMGGLGSSFISGQDISRTFTVAFREYQNLPVFNTIELWTSVFDQHLGVSPLAGDEFVPANYKGSAAVFLCRPTIGESGCTTLKIEDIEQLYLYDGVFPETVPHDSFSADITGNDTVQLSITFSFDGHPITKATAEEADVASIIGVVNSMATKNPSYEAINVKGEIAGPKAAWVNGTKEKNQTA